MGALATIIGAISDDVVARLAAAGYPALVDGRIVVGTAAEYEQTAPPRIIFDPSPGSKFAAPEYSSASAVLSTEERRRQAAFRPIAAENVMFSVHCWGAAGTSEPVDDYDVTRALVHAVRASLHAKMPGAYTIEESGKYRVGTNVVRLGRWYTFGLTVFTPVLSTLAPYAVANRSAGQITAASDDLYAPDDVQPNGTLTMLQETVSP